MLAVPPTHGDLGTDSLSLSHLHKINVIFLPALMKVCGGRRGRNEVISVKMFGEEKCLIIVKGQL